MEPNKVGRPRERPEGEHPFTARLPEKTYRTLKLLAASQGIPINRALCAAVAEWIKKQPGHEELARVVEQAIHAEPDHG